MTDNPTQLENKLEPCPFAAAVGGKHSLETKEDSNRWKPFQWIVTCWCGATGPQRSTEADAITAWNYRPPVVAQEDACTDCAAIEREAWQQFNNSHKGSASLRCENHRDPSPSSPVPPEALARASKLCRSTIPGARVELIFQDLQDAQAVHKWLCNLNSPAATPTPVEQEPRTVQHLVNQWQACWLSTQDISRDSESDLVRRIERFIATPSPSLAAREAAEAQACWVDPDDPRRVKMIFETAEIASAFVDNFARTYSVGEGRK